MPAFPFGYPQLTNPTAILDRLPITFVAHRNSVYAGQDAGTRALILHALQPVIEGCPSLFIDVFPYLNHKSSVVDTCPSRQLYLAPAWHLGSGGRVQGAGVQGAAD